MIVIFSDVCYCIWAFTDHCCCVCANKYCLLSIVYKYSATGTALLVQGNAVAGGGETRCRALTIGEGLWIKISLFTVAL